MEEGKDAAIFWATGAGKSLTYQLPPLHLNQVAIVISPLISLMQDQCAKLNSRAGGLEIAHIWDLLRVIPKQKRGP